MSFDANEAEQALRYIWDHFGHAEAANQTRMKALLRDLLPRNRRESRVLTSVFAYVQRTPVTQAEDIMKALRRQDMLAKYLAMYAPDLERSDVAAALKTIAASLQSTRVVMDDSPAPQLVGECVTKADVYANQTSTQALLSSTRIIGYKAFYARADLTELSIPANVELVYAKAFGYCTQLRSITFAANPKNIGAWAFRGCTSLTQISLPEGRYLYRNGFLIDRQQKTLLWTSTGFTQRAVVPEGITQLAAFSMEDVQARQILLPSTLAQLSGGAIRNCSQLYGVSVAPANRSYCACQGVLYTKDRKQLILYPAMHPEANYYTEEETVEIAAEAFAGARRLQTVTLTAGLRSIGAKAFSGCAKLQRVMLPRGVQTIAYGTFEGCTALNMMMIPNTVEQIGDYAFAGCESLSGVALPMRLTSLGAHAFSHCSRLTRVSISDQVKEIGPDAFAGCHPDLRVEIHNNPYAEQYCRAHGVHIAVV